ncbi:MAG: hypothetical protein GDA53_06440 [Rhodobacteraceae bacterium]|nr:hypothetical protein [Paracoccaceae bacterium]
MTGFFRFAVRTPVLIASLIGTLVLLLLVFPNLPVGGPTLDTQIRYDFAHAHALLEHYGEAGRRMYVRASLTLDTILPMFYATCFSGLICRFSPLPGLRRCAYLPILTALFDLGENAQVMAMLIQYPDISEWQVQCASAFTQIKWLLAALSILCAAVFVMSAAIVRIAARMHTI